MLVCYVALNSSAPGMSALLLEMNFATAGHTIEMSAQRSHPSVEVAARYNWSTKWVQSLLMHSIALGLGNVVDLVRYGGLSTAEKHSSW